jgi:HPt (histidine-containing phosphotransfer) domain-containing protein
MGSWLFRSYLFGQLLAIVGLGFLGEESWTRVIWQVVVGAGSCAVAVVGMRRHRPGGAAAFYLFGAGVFLNAAGLLVEAIVTRVFKVNSSPSLADAFWLAIYPGLIGGMGLLIRHRQAQRDWATLIDTTIIALGLGLLSWVFIIRPVASSAGSGLLALIAVVAYPVADLVVLAMMVRLLLGGGKRNAAFFLMIAAVVSLLLVDVGWAVIAQVGRAPPALHLVLSAGSLLAFALIGAAALHPSVREIAQPMPRPEGLGRGLLAGLALASLTAPAVLMWQTSHGQITDGRAIAVSSAALFLLVVARMRGLLRRLEERTRELGARNRSTRLVLDTINQGLVRVASDGSVFEERSAMVDRWFGPCAGRPRLCDYLEPLDPIFAASFQLGHEALQEGILPPEVVLQQLPAQLRAAGRHFTVSYLPVHDHDRADRAGGLLLVINDVTESLTLARHEAEQRELLALSQAWSRDRAGLLRFFDDSDRLLAETLSAAAPIDRRRALHTLKGNTSLLGLNVMAQLCHDTEDRLETGSEARPALEALHARWRQLREVVATLGGDREHDLWEIDERELASLSSLVGSGLPRSRIMRRLAAWRCERVERSLARLARHARALAARLGKGDLLVDIDAGGLRLDPARWGAFWSEMVHVVNNAVDHGLEAPESRRAAGKPAQPRLRLSAQVTGQALVIALEDDGVGVDWDAIAEKAAGLGMPSATRADLLAALLTPGVSTQSRATMVSGRGMGMAAVRARVDALGGKIAVTSECGHGTTWRFSFPLSALSEAERENAVPVEEPAAVGAR